MNSGKIYKRHDAVIVLANLMNADGSLQAESAARARLSADIFKESQTPYLVTCGWAYRDDSDIRIADAFKTHIASAFEISPERIIAETNPRDTVGDAWFTKINLSEPRGWKNICVVTSDYHVDRTREIFQFIYGPEYAVAVCGAPAPASESAPASELKSIRAFRDTFAGVEAGNNAQIFNALRERHPFYNGLVYDKI